MATSEGSTVIGESILVSGNLSGDEDLSVRGRLEGTVTLTKSLVVESTGVVRAEVHVKSCVVSGAVVGNITASESVELTKDARMVGDITAPRVIVVDGASFRGRIDMGEVDVDQSGQPGLVRASPRPALRAPPPRPAEVQEEAQAGEKAARPSPPPVPVAMGAVKRKVVVRRK